MRVPRPSTNCPCSERHSQNGGASYPRLASTSGNSAATANSPIAFVAKTLSHSPLPVARLNGEEILSAAMIVGEPNPLVGGVHDRMPVMLLPEDYDGWLGSTTAPENLRNLLRPYDESLMEAYAVSRKVNSVKNDTEEMHRTYRR